LQGVKEYEEEENP